jgi:hypothetical protein
MDGEVLVYVDLDGIPHLAGHLWTRLRKNKESATFEYDPDWLRHPARFALEPALMLGPGAFHTAPDAPALWRDRRLGAGPLGARSCGVYHGDRPNARAARFARFARSIIC